VAKGNPELFAKLIVIAPQHWRGNHGLCRKFKTHPKKWVEKHRNINEVQYKWLVQFFQELADSAIQHVHGYTTSLLESFFHKRLKWVSKYTFYPEHYPFWCNIAALSWQIGPHWVVWMREVYMYGQKP
jgi:hypothetical protein